MQAGKGGRCFGYHCLPPSVITCSPATLDEEAAIAHVTSQQQRSMTTHQKHSRQRTRFSPRRLPTPEQGRGRDMPSTGRHRPDCASEIPPNQSTPARRPKQKVGINRESSSYPCDQSILHMSSHRMKSFQSRPGSASAARDGKPSICLLHSISP
jgi:hypothetical protein